MATQLKWSLKRDRLPGGDEVWTGQIELPVTKQFAMPMQMLNASASSAPVMAKSIKLKATESSKKDAMDSVLNAANKLMENPLIADLLPPGAQTAVAVAKKLVRTKAAKKALKSGSKKAAKFLKSLW